MCPTLGRVVDSTGIEGRIALVTAGWREREAEDRELVEHLGGRAVNLQLYRRAEEIFTRDTELFEAHLACQRALRQLHTLYRLRLDHQMAALRALLARNEPAEILDAEIEKAFEAVRALDAAHVERMRERRGELAALEPGRRQAVQDHLEEIDRILEECEAVAIAGGHVVVLASRLRLFDLLGRWGERPIFAWSAGAMVLAERVVLFHDSPPQGFGHAEVYDAGLRRFVRLQPLPGTDRRLRLADRERVAILARRLAPTVGVPMDGGEHLVLRGTSLWTESPLRRLTVGGTVEELQGD